ncbi:SapC family protein [Phenylobacterium sp.]|uniref:SapC family protein n=1 Tax=Phenylobacterium sp. TaxID=1871053 RepID=UPI0027319E08|nr:SapC family protein [Phenylobacterium sp.]MDP1875165.1 SapC family protein [Phenylobacterium sp.]
MKPLFYDKPVTISLQRHGALQLRAPMDFGFARATNAVPLTLAEIPLAAQWYPIAFSAGEAARPVAILGLREGENLFVDDEGGWREGAYVPIYVRRYPFILRQEDDLVALCIEEADDVLLPSGGAPLFAEGEPAELLQSAMQFCRSAQAAERATIPFVEGLRALGLLDGRTATIAMPDGGKVSLSGFLTIDEARLRGLSDDSFLELRRRGWLSAIFSQIQSTLNWGRLADRMCAVAAA